MVVCGGGEVGNGMVHLKSTQHHSTVQNNHGMLQQYSRRTCNTAELRNTHNCFTDVWTLSGTTRLSWYQKKHSLTHLSWSSLICFLHLLRSMATPPVQLTCLTVFFHISVQVFFGLPLGLALSTS